MRTMSGGKLASLFNNWYARFISLQGITLDCAGTIRSFTDTPSPPLLSIEKFDTRSCSDLMSHVPATPRTTLEFLLDTITRRKQHEMEMYEDEPVIPQCGHLRKLFTYLHARSFLPGEDVFYFCHLNLAGILD